MQVLLTHLQRFKLCPNSKIVRSLAVFSELKCWVSRRCFTLKAMGNSQSCLINPSATSYNVTVFIICAAYCMYINQQAISVCIDPLHHTIYPAVITFLGFIAEHVRWEVLRSVDMMPVCHRVNWYRQINRFTPTSMPEENSLIHTAYISQFPEKKLKEGSCLQMLMIHISWPILLWIKLGQRDVVTVT